MQHCVHSSRDDADLLDNEVTGVENDTALDVAARSHGLHEGLRDGLLVGPQIVDQLVIGHANATVPSRDGGVDLVRDELDVEIELALNPKCPTHRIGSKVREELWTQHFSQIIDALVGEEIVIPLPIELLGHVAPRAQGSQRY